MDYSPLASTVRGISQARILEWVNHFLPQGIYSTQGSNPCLLYWQVDCFTAEPPGELHNLKLLNKTFHIALENGNILLCTYQLWINKSVGILDSVYYLSGIIKISRGLNSDKP